MAILRPKEIREMADKDVASKLVELKKELMKLKLQTATGASKDAGKIKAIKRTIARVLTLKPMIGGQQKKA